jgi:hypothetical protein
VNAVATKRLNANLYNIYLILRFNPAAAAASLLGSLLVMVFGGLHLIVPGHVWLLVAILGRAFPPGRFSVFKPLVGAPPKQRVMEGRKLFVEDLLFKLFDGLDFIVELVMLV